MRMAVAKMLECAQVVVRKNLPGEEGLCLEQKVTNAINRDMIERNIEADALVTLRFAEGLATYWYKADVKKIRMRKTSSST
jgi:hypothetical protein